MKSFNSFLDEEAQVLAESSALTKTFAVAQYLSFRGEKNKLSILTKQLLDTANLIDRTKDESQLKSAQAKALRLNAQIADQLSQLLSTIINVSAVAAALAGENGISGSRKK